MVLSFKSRQQRTVALSTTESEYIAAVSGAKKILFFANLIEVLNFKVESKTLLCDNLGAVYIAKGTNPTKIKHLEVKMFWLREVEDEEKLMIDYVSTEENIADIFTKALPLKRFTKLRSFMMN